MTWSVDELREAGRLTLDVLAEYVEASRRGQEPAVALPPMDEVEQTLQLRSLIQRGGLDLHRLPAFLRSYLDGTTRLHHPGYLAHQVAVPDLPAAVADLIHGVTNNPTAIYEMGAAGASVERAVVTWMAEKLGFDARRGGGVLTHGGSLANLTALLAARARMAPRAWTEGVPGDLAVLAPPTAHYSIARAVSIMGLGARAVLPLPVDRLGRIRVAAVAAAVAAARARGHRVLALVANAGATATGLHDDLLALGGTCTELGVWLHVDGAHGASALLTRSYRDPLRGIEQAASVTWDAHKMLRTSGLCAAALFRDASVLDAAFHQEASYLFDTQARAGVDTLRHTVECTKAALGLKLFLNLAWRGEQGLADYVERQYRLTRDIWALIRSRPGFECPFEPESNILCFRYGRSGDRQLALREALLREGRFHITSAQIDGERFLRLTVMSPATSVQTVEELLDEIVRVDDRISAGGVKPASLEQRVPEPREVAGS